MNAGRGAGSAVAGLRGSAEQERKVLGSVKPDGSEENGALGAEEARKPSQSKRLVIAAEKEGGEELSAARKAGGGRRGRSGTREVAEGQRWGKCGTGASGRPRGLTASECAQRTHSRFSGVPFGPLDRWESTMHAGGRGLPAVDRVRRMIADRWRRISDLWQRVFSVSLEVFATRPPLPQYSRPHSGLSRQCIASQTRKTPSHCFLPPPPLLPL